MVRIKRIYDPPSDEDGYRVLVDRLWPRGLTRESAEIDAWLKDIAPSDLLRKQYGHDPFRRDEFREQYLVELHEHVDKVSALLLKAEAATVNPAFCCKRSRAQ